MIPRIDEPALFDDAVGQRRFAVVYVGDDGKISDMS